MSAPRRGRPDLRAAVLGLVAWLSAVAALRAPGWLLVAGAAAGTLWVLCRPNRTALAWVLVAGVVGGVALLRAEEVRRSGIADLVDDRATVTVEVRLTSDPVLRRGRFHSYVLARATLLEVTGRGRTVRTDAPVLVLADKDWRRLALDSRIRGHGRLGPAEGAELAGVLTTRGPPEVLARPPVLLRGVDRLRAAVRDAVADQPSAPRALVPALVDGDDTGLSREVADDFRTAGLTHLLAVSGTNLTLIVGFLLGMSRWAGVRARGLLVVGILGVIGFVLLARTEPSVVRAAAMGTVGLIGMGSNGRERGSRALGVAVCGLLLHDPWLAVSAGFALSVCATAGILLLAPGWRDALAGWCPRWLAEAAAVPLAAQLACTPIVAALTGEVSLVAVFANVLAAPLVGPATVLGLLGGVAAVAWTGLGKVVAAPAAWCATGIVAVARTAAELPVAAVAWPVTALSLALLTALCVALALGLAVVLARRGPALGACGLLVVMLLVPLPTPGWPPPGWVMVACDVGQGDAIVLRVGAGSGVVVDAGPEPEHVDRCLRRLGVRQVPLVLLTHFHADHVDGLPGVLADRDVGEVVVGPVAEPLSGARAVFATAHQARVPVRVGEYGEAGSLGPLRWQVLAPGRLRFADSESVPNDASLVLLVEVRGLRLLLMGDQERPSQALLRRALPTLHADVLKVAHHGSSKQDEDLIAGLGARLAVISCGRDNEYGHPATTALRALERAGLQVARTDRDGDVAVVVDAEGRLRLRTRIPRDRPPPGAGGAA